jgi:hypothetical protein
VLTAFAFVAVAQQNPADTVVDHDIHAAIDLSAQARMKAEEAAEQAKIDSLTKLVTPEQAARIDSIVAMRLRLARKRIESVPPIDSLAVLDTLPSGDDAVQVVLFANSTWKYIRNRAVQKDSTIFEKYWDNEKLFPYKDVEYSSLPKSLVIDLVDSTNGYHTPYKPSPIRSRYGPRRGRAHQGVDLALKAGEKIYATITASAVNVRKGPGPTYGTVKALHRGDVVQIFEQTAVDGRIWGRCEAGWFRITGYARLETVTEEEEEGQQPDDGQPDSGTVIPPVTPEPDVDLPDAPIHATILGSEPMAVRKGPHKTYPSCGEYAVNTHVEILEFTYFLDTIWGRTDKGWIVLSYVDFG